LKRNEETTNRTEEYLEMMELPQFEEYTFWEQLQDRKIILNGQIDDNVVERIIIQILKFNEQDKDIPKDRRKPIILYLNSYGGVVDIGLVLANVIEKSETPIHIIVLGNAASMAAIILMAGHKRMAYPFSNILIHDGSMFVGGSTSKVKDTMKYQDEKEEQVKEFILKYTKISEDKYKEKYQSEWWMTSQQALEYGVIDEII
jgi:ATP-dependent Clp protease protease subunit